MQSHAELMGAVSDVARDLFAAKFPQFEGTTLEVRYFGNGSKFSVSKDRNGNLKVTLYIHKDSTNKLPQLIDDAGAAVKRITEKRVTIRRELLSKLYEIRADAVLTTKEEMEVYSLLSEKN